MSNLSKKVISHFESLDCEPPNNWGELIIISILTFCFSFGLLFIFFYNLNYESIRKGTIPFLALNAPIFFYLSIVVFFYV